MASPALSTNNVDEVREYLREKIIARHGSLAAYARKRETVVSYISNILRGVKPIPKWMLKSFRIKYTETWQVE